MTFTDEFLSEPIHKWYVLYLTFKHHLRRTVFLFVAFKFLNLNNVYQQLWKDPRFKWAPASYEGLESIHVPSNLIWTVNKRLIHFKEKMNRCFCFFTGFPS